jgi:ABC-2 type transport system permease protein
MARWFSLQRTLAVARKEFRQLARDRMTLAFILGIPALQLVLFGYAIDLDVRHVPTGVVDRSNTALSRQLVARLEATQTFRIEREVADEREAMRLLESSELGAVVIIPPDFERRRARGRGAEISILTDASNPSVASAVLRASRGLEQWLRERPSIGSRERSAVGQPGPPGPAAELVHPSTIEVHTIPYFNPEQRTAVFIVPGLIGVILTMTMMMMTALALVREREHGTFEFLIATPIKSIELMIGKVLPYLVVGHVEVAVVLLLGAWLFEVPIRGSLLDLGIGSLPFLMAMLALGLVISSFTRTQFQATQMSFFVFLPSILLSGFMFPFEAMALPAQWLGELLPLTHFVRISRGVLIKGAGIESLLSEVAILLAILVAALALAVTTFRKRLE